MPDLKSSTHQSRRFRWLILLLGAPLLMRWTLQLFANKAQQLHSSKRLKALMDHKIKPVRVPKHLQKKFDQDGFVVLRKVIPKEAAMELKEDLMAQGVASPETNVFRKILVASKLSRKFFMVLPRFQPIADLAFLSGVVDAVKQVVGASSLYYLADVLFTRGPGDKVDDWHRDHAFLRVAQDKMDIVTAWMTLASTTGSPESGSMILAKGSHKWTAADGCDGKDHLAGYLAHPDWDGYQECMDRLQAVATPLPALDPGDVVVFSPNLYHRSAGAKDLLEARMAVAIFMATDKATFDLDQSPYQCVLKSAVTLKLEEAARHASAGSENDLHLGQWLPEIAPEHVLTAPKLLRTFSSDTAVPRVKHMLSHTLFGCSLQRMMGKIPHSYRAESSNESA